MPEQVGSLDQQQIGRSDPLGRRVLATALADKLVDHVSSPRHLDPGPTVVTIEGPWGCGKSTLLDRVREQLPHPPRSSVSPRRLSVRQASRLLREGLSREGTPPAHVPPPVDRPRGVVTAWFNPWAHQSGEQVWAGLVAEIIEAAQPVLYPTEAARERYWFTRNLTRVDRYALRRTLHRRIVSPELTVGALGVVASLAIAVAELHTTITVAGTQIPTAIMALLLSGSFLLMGAIHTGWRYVRGIAARFLPGELFHGPVSSAAAADIESADAGRTDGLNDPLRRARAGSLYLHQHDVSELVADLDQAGYELIVFVDDLDRCRALTTAEVFEAINLFLAGFVSERRGTGRETLGDPGSLRARFVIGLDPVVVAGHLDRVYADLYDPETALDGEDPGPGWAFLRKLVHLPVLVPQVSDDEMFRVVERITSGAGLPRPEASDARPRPQRGGPTGHPDPDIASLLHSRLIAQPDRSVREATRQLHVWDFYERVLRAEAPLDDPDEARVRTRRLIILGEIVTRWPALQRFLHRRIGTRTGLQRLAEAADDDVAWPVVAESVLGGRATYDDALTTLRELLCEHDGRGVADLATRLL